MSAALACACWCGSQEVMVPVEWVGEGRTESCSQGCEPGCELHERDAFDEPETPPAPPPLGQQVRKRMKTDQYDPKAESSPDVSGLFEAYPNSLILTWAPGLCQCGCGKATSRKGRFVPGHDARLKGMLSRAHAAGADLVLVGPGGECQTQEIETFAESYGGSWWDKIRRGAERIKTRSSTPIEAEKRLARKTEAGWPGYTLVSFGRWASTGRALAVWRNDETGEDTFEYVTTSGATQVVAEKELAS